MVAYQHFVDLSRSGDGDERGQAARLAAMAYVAHDGPADEHAALYAALMGFLDDASVKVRAALAYGLLHEACAPRPVMLALAQDAPVIARAVVQYSPVLLDADLIGVARRAEPQTLTALAARAVLSPRLAAAILARGEAEASLRVLGRPEIAIDAAVLEGLATAAADDARLRGALLARPDLPAQARYLLVEQVRDALLGLRLVHGAVAPRRLNGLMRDAVDRALTAIGEREVALARPGYTAGLVADEKVSARLMLQALVNGHVLFFADCVRQLAEVPRRKVFGLIDAGSRPALRALFGRCGLKPALAGLFARLVMLAREADLADDLAARHFVVTLLIEELIALHDADIPSELEEAFAYLSEQNIRLARHAARGVMPAFAADVSEERWLPAIEVTIEVAEERLALPAA